MYLDRLSSKVSPRQSRTIIFCLFVLFIILHHFFAFLGVYAMDDLNYIALAAKVATGNGLVVNTDDHFELRWLAIYGTAFFYRVFGINDYTSCAFDFIAIIVSGYLINRILKGASILILVLALCLFFFNYEILFTTHRLWADTGVCVFGFSAFYFYLKAWEGKDPIVNAVACSACLFLAMISKETVILFVPLVLFLLVRDLARKSLIKFWITAACSSLITVVCYLGYFKVQTGDWLFRYHILQLSSSGNCHYELMPFIETIKRIGYLLWQSFLLDGGLLYLIFGLCGFVYRKSLMAQGRVRQISIAFLVLLLSADLMTISIHAYVPLCPDTRHFIFLYPLAAISGSYFLVRYFQDPFKYLLAPVLVCLAMIWIFISNGGEMKYIYLLISLILLFPLFHRKSFGEYRSSRFYIVMLTAVLLIRPAYDLFHHDRDYYYDHKQLIISTVPGITKPSIIFSGDDITPELSVYFMSYSTGKISFKNIARTYAVSTSENYFLISGQYNPILQSAVEKFTVIDHHPALSLKARINGVSLYKINYLPVLDSLKKFSTKSL